MTFENRHPSRAAMRRLTSNFRTCDTFSGGYDGHLAYQNAYAFWNTNINNIKHRKSQLRDLEGVVDGGNYQDHKSGRTHIYDHRIMDHVEHWRLENTQRAPFLISHPYLDPEDVHQEVKENPLPAGLDYRVLDPKFDWYIPGTTSLVFVGRTDVLEELIYEWQNLPMIGSATTFSVDPYSTDQEFLKTVEQAEEVIMDTLFRSINAGQVNAFGGIGETVLENAVVLASEPGFLGEDLFKPAIDNLRKNALVVQIEGPGLFYAPSIIAWKPQENRIQNS